jgi:hypothetical protein
MIQLVYEESVSHWGRVRHKDNALCSVTENSHSNPAATKIVATPAAVYQTHGDGTIWAYTGPPISGWQMLDNNPRERLTVANGRLFQLHGDGTVWIYNGPPLTGWQTLDTNPATTQIMAAQ